MSVAIIDYGAGNLRSVSSALARLGVTAEVTASPERLAAAERVIFPGVGHAAPAMRALRAAGLDRLIPQLRQPVLGICLGMQLMYAQSEEGTTKGLGIFPGLVRLLSDVPKLPHMGWNEITSLQGSLFAGLADETCCYFVHSFAAPVDDSTAAVTTYGLSFAAAARKDNFYACQFHPEKSAQGGARILENFMQI